MFSLYSEKMPKRERSAFDALAAVLPPGSVALSERADGSLTATLPDRSRRRLVLAWAGHGYPRDVQRTLLDPEVVAARVQGDLTVVAAHSLSPGARQLLRAEGVSWVGVDGSAELRLGTVWIDRDGSSAGRTAERPTAWSPARAEVAEALFAVLTDRDPSGSGSDEVPDVETMARLAGRSFGTTANTLAVLDAQGWTAPGTRARARIVTDGPAMLDSWAAWNTERHRRFDGFHSIHRSPGDVVDELLEAFGNDLILTGAAASEQVRPTLTGGWVVTAYVADGSGWSGIEATTRRARLVPAAVPRIRLAPAPPVVEHTTSIARGLRVASPARVYADLAAGSDREREAAELFRATTMGILS